MLLTRRAAIHAIVAGGVGTTVGTGTYGLAYERHQTQVIHTTLPVSNLPPPLDGLRVGLITDLHRSDTVPQEDVEHAADLMMREKPDLIVLGGDFVTMGQLEYARPCAEALGKLSAPLGVFAVLGNHDDDREVPAALEAKGFPVLRDARTTVTARGEAFDIAGIDFWTRPRQVARVLRGPRPPLMLLAHDPRRLDEAAGFGVGVVLSGHTHGGQVNLPLLGPVAARKFPIIAGAGRRLDTSIFVSRGVGTVYLPYRLNCPPDVSVITLTPH